MSKFKTKESGLDQIKKFKNPKKIQKKENIDIKKVETDKKNELNTKDLISEIYVCRLTHPSLDAVAALSPRKTGSATILSDVHTADYLCQGPAPPPRPTGRAH